MSTVLVVDDEADIRELVRLNLELDGHDVILAADGSVEKTYALYEAIGRAYGLNPDRIVCGAGPGSFTSLRIAASIAKGIAVGRSIPLFAVSSLALMVAGNVSDGPRGPRRYLAVLDALRGDCFVADFEHHQGAVREVAPARLIRTDEVEATAAANGARAVGPELPHNWLPHARGTALMLDEILAAGPVELASWEPIYGRLAEAQVKWEAAHGRTLPH